MDTWIGSRYKSTGGLKVHVIEVFGDVYSGYYIDNLFIGSSPDNCKEELSSPLLLSMCIPATLSMSSKHVYF